MWALCCAMELTSWGHNHLCLRTREQCRSQSTRIEVNKPSLGSPLAGVPGITADTHVFKNPTSCWARNKSKDPSETRINTVLEISWARESIEDLERELSLWHSSGRNAVVLKIWWNGQEGDAAALRQALPGWNESMDEWIRHASILFITQGAQDPCKRVWRVGHPARDIRLSHPERTTEMREWTNPRLDLGTPMRSA